MDRDLRWEKERQAFDAMVTGHPEGGTYADPGRAHPRALQQRHHRRVHPALHLHQPTEGTPVGLIRDHDVVINFNYRADRARQITRVLTRNSGLTDDPIGSQGHISPKPSNSTPRCRSTSFPKTSTTSA